jgi:magnesium chelatase family protein
LFLDELPEFSRDVLDGVHQALGEDFPSSHGALLTSVLLVCSMDSCPCGFYGDSRRQCTCSSTQIRRYLSRISGPLLDRIDLHVEVPRLSVQELMARAPGESSATVRQRVRRAREIQVKRLAPEGLTCNAQIKARQLREYCQLEGGAADLLRCAINQFGLSARAYDRILKVARTVADLDSSETIELHHVAEAINYRTLDRKLFSA